MTQGYYNPQVNYWQNQMRNLANGYNPYQPVNPMTMQQPTNQFPCRAVGSKDEARNAILDNLSIPYIFTNFPNNEIYVKYTENTTGQAKTVTFVPEQENKTIQISENDILKSKIEVLEQNIISLKAEIETIKGGVNNVQSADDTDVKDGTKSNGRNAKNVQQ
ncbi:MAG: hypothetical protein IKU37_08965 [Candidatus Gastranaerophilales bacterium]|nr:hypothetical protein [Candidatus Gastranaerophilales bacterium]